MSLMSATHPDEDVELEPAAAVDTAPGDLSDGGHPDRRGRTRRKLLTVGVACAVLVVAGSSAYLVLDRAARGAPAQSAGPAPLAAGSVAYSNPAAGYTLNYPGSWQRSVAAANSVILNLNGQDAVSIEAFSLKSAVNTGNLAAMRAVTDAILSDPSAHLTVLMTQQVSIGGLNGLYYLYYFPNGKQEGVHGHYFLFSGMHMYTLVFQASSTPRFQQLASTFDAVADSFRASGR
jgi:hypothetical protein